MDTYKIGSTHENHLGPPSPKEITRKPDESREDLAKRIMDGVPLETWAVITHGQGWMDVRPVASKEDGDAEVDASREHDIERRRQYPDDPLHGHYSHTVEYLRATAVNVSVDYVAGEPPEKAQK